MAPGSSPRARGALPHDAAHHGRPGLIPAGAGSTMRFRTSRIVWRAHPRGRGEHVGVPGRPGSDVGSSPRARGAHQGLVRSDHRRGLIPAGAGSTTIPKTARSARGAHPRGRGEHDFVFRTMVDQLGSSPRARGALGRRPRWATGAGLIPAGAGSTSWQPRWTRSPRAHPRGRGEHYPDHMREDGLSGSSPRARGAQMLSGRPRPSVRLIPAGAGSTARSSTPTPPRRAHPRGRGEHPLATRSRALVAGSSPRARGALVRLEARDRVGRLIPAGAGSTSASVTIPGCSRAHPRGRGEHLEPSEIKRGMAGSSPRARGARARPGARPARLRLIPAGAGSTSPACPTPAAARAHPRGRGEHGLA